VRWPPSIRHSKLRRPAARQNRRLHHPAVQSRHSRHRSLRLYSIDLLGKPLPSATIRVRCHGQFVSNVSAEPFAKKIDRTCIDPPKTAQKIVAEPSTAQGTNRICSFIRPVPDPIRRLKSTANCGMAQARSQVLFDNPNPQAWSRRFPRVENRAAHFPSSLNWSLNVFHAQTRNTAHRL